MQRVQQPPNFFDSRLKLVEAIIPDGQVTTLADQLPTNDKWFDLTLPELRAYTRGDLGRIMSEHDDVCDLHSRLSGVADWTKDSLAELSSEQSPRGHRFREAIWAGVSDGVRHALRDAIFDPSRSLPVPQDLFNHLLLKGAVRIPPEEFLPLDKLMACRDPMTIIDLAEKIWAYSGFEGIAGDHGYSDLENPPSATLSEYHGNPSRAGFDLKSRVAWSAEYQTALVTRTPIALSNMEAASDLKSCRLAREAGVLPVLFSVAAEERRAAASEFGKDIFITVRTSAKEMKLATELIDLGANVHIELANASNPKGIAAIIELKDYIRQKKFAEPRFVSIGKGVGGSFFIAAALAGADVIWINRGSSIICSTPTVSGSGIRTWSACYEVALAQRIIKILTGRDVPFWGDAGITVGGDITKLLFAGAEGGMVGTTFVRTIDSPPRKIKVELPKNLFDWRTWFGKRALFEWLTASWGDASEFGMRHNPKGKNRGVAAQGVLTYQRIPRGSNGEPITIAEVAEQLRLGIQAGGADAYVDSVVKLPIWDRHEHFRFPESGAARELQAKASELPQGKILREILSRVA